MVILRENQPPPSQKKFGVQNVHFLSEHSDCRVRMAAAWKHGG